jgi:large subunit ribosomal protein L29
MKAKELQGKTPAALNEDLLKLRREQFNLRMARATGQAAKPDQFAKVRKNIARVKTVLAQTRARGGKALCRPKRMLRKGKPRLPRKASPSGSPTAKW